MSGSTKGSLDYMPTRPVVSQQSVSSAAVRRREAYNRLGVGGFVELGANGVLPKILCVEISADTVLAIVPPDQHVGRVIQFSQLWKSAVEEVGVVNLWAILWSCLSASKGILCCSGVTWGIDCP